MQRFCRRAAIARPSRAACVAHSDSNGCFTRVGGPTAPAELAHTFGPKGSINSFKPFTVHAGVDAEGALTIRLQQGERTVTSFDRALAGNPQGVCKTHATTQHSHPPCMLCAQAATHVLRYTPPHLSPSSRSLPPQRVHVHALTRVSLTLACARVLLARDGAVWSSTVSASSDLGCYGQARARRITVVIT